MWYVRDVLYAVLYVRVSCFVVRGCAVSRRYINVCNCDMFSVVYMYLDHLKFCVVCIDGRRYVCCSECNVVSNECNEPTSCLVQPIGSQCCEVMYFGCFGFRGELGFLNCDDVVVVCPLQPSSSVNSGCPGPESSILVSSRWACPISSQVTDHWGELRNRTGDVHPVDPFHSLDILKNHFASVAFCRNSGVYNVQNGAVIELSFVISVKGSPRH